MHKTDEAEKSRITVADFVMRASGRLETEIHSTQEVLHDHWLESPRVQKLGLALSGFADKIHRGRIQIFGNSERSYLAKLTPAERDRAFDRLDRANVSCVLITASKGSDRELLEFAAGHDIPVISTPVPSSEAIAAVSEILAIALAPSATIHGVLMEVFGIGVLILGDSGLGKSECALDLITRGHRLIADDSVLLKRIGDRIEGEAPENIRDYLEIRGLGIINARELFGVSALAGSTDVKFCIEFSSVPDTASDDRLGLEQTRLGILGVDITRYPLPVTPGRNLATLVEAAVRVFVSRKSGSNAANELISRHNAAIAAREA